MHFLPLRVMKATAAIQEQNKEFCYRRFPQTHVTTVTSVENNLLPISLFFLDQHQFVF